jgi:hypothetical protein
MLAQSLAHDVEPAGKRRITEGAVTLSGDGGLDCRDQRLLGLGFLATAVSFHSNFVDKNQMIHFLKNVMMAGGLLQIAAFGAGAISIARWRHKSAAPAAMNA